MKNKKHLSFKILIFTVFSCFFYSVSIGSDSVDALGKEFGVLSINSSPPRFVLNVIAYVPDQEEYSYDSSDEEDDRTFDSGLFDFDVEDEKKFPFRTFTVKKSRKNSEKKKDNEKKDIVNKTGTVDPTDLEETTHENESNSKIILPFLKKLEEGAFDPKDKRHFYSSIRVVIGLNRPCSLSTRKNNHLKQEFAQSTLLPQYCKRFGFFWTPQWFDSSNNLVEYCRVRKFYKQLKRKDSKKAQLFRKLNEKRALVPYQDLRERVKNHSLTKNFVTTLREESQNSPVYLSIVDSDTIDFNGIYSAYLRLIKNHDHPITAMTTGYIFQGNAESGDYPFKVASELDRNIRIAIAQHIPLGVYYPEPNLCILIPKNQNTVMESFVNGKTDRESAALLRELKNRPNSFFVFSGDNPLITDIPSRARLTKTHKTPINFSPEFKKGASPTEKDIMKLKHVSQSHFNELSMSKNLYINRPFSVQGSQGVSGHLNSLLVNFLKNLTNSQNYEAIEKIVGDKTAKSIQKAFENMKKEISNFTVKNQRTLDEQEILDYLIKKNINISLVPKDKIQIFSQKDVKGLILEKILDINELLDIPSKTLREIFYAESLERLEDETISFEDLLRLHELCPDEFSDLFEKFCEFEYISSQDIDEFIRLYEEDPLHIDCIVEDPIEMALELAPSVNGLILSYIEEPEDIAWIREQLCESDQMIFNSNLNNYYFTQEGELDDDNNQSYSDEEEGVSGYNSDYDTEYNDYFEKFYASDEDSDYLP